MRTASRFLCLAAALCCGLGAAAQAEDSAPPSDPPAVPANPLPGTPPPAAPQAAPSGTAPDLQSCLQETGDYGTRGKSVVYVIGIANSCDKRLRCEIFANVTGAKGSSLGHTVMVLGAAASGAAAKKTFTMRVKAAGGTVMVSRDCKVL